MGIKCCAALGRGESTREYTTHGQGRAKKASENAGLGEAREKLNDPEHLADIDIPPRTRFPPLRLIATKTNFPLTLFPRGN